MSKTAIITGAAQGIGAAIAIRLAKDGFDVAINCRSQASADTRGAAVAEACRAFGVKAECFVADVSDYAQCEAMVKKVKAEYESVDVLVNNAGITRDGLLARMKEEQYDSVIQANQKSTFNMMQLASMVMIKQKSGRIINMSSVVGVYGNPGQVNYAASKAAIIGMTKSAAKELGPRGITVNAVAPGFVETPMTDLLTEEQRAKILGAIAMKRCGEPEEIAALVAFLASDEAGYITGQVIEISGGLTI